MTNADAGQESLWQRVSSDDEELLRRYVLEYRNSEDGRDAQSRIAEDPACRALYEDMLRTLPKPANARFTPGEPYYQGTAPLDELISQTWRTTHDDNARAQAVLEFGMSLACAADFAGLTVEETRERLDRAVYWQARYLERRIERWPSNMPLMIRQMRDARREASCMSITEAEELTFEDRSPRRSDDSRERLLLPEEQADMRLIHDFILWCRPEDEAEFTARLDDIHFRCLATCVLLVWTC